jgi:hypothetical protein
MNRDSGFCFCLGGGFVFAVVSRLAVESTQPLVQSLSGASLSLGIK